MMWRVRQEVVFKPEVNVLKLMAKEDMHGGNIW